MTNPGFPTAPFPVINGLQAIYCLVSSSPSGNICKIDNLTTSIVSQRFGYNVQDNVLCYIIIFFFSIFDNKQAHSTKRKTEN